jgi:hypothetical protein
VTADDYVREVERALGDLPWSERRHLVADLRHHLAELPAETDLEARLGTPEQYAADLRAAEGLERRRGPAAFMRARRPRTLIIAAVAIAAVGLAVGLAIAAKVRHDERMAFIDHYQPLQNAGADASPANAKPTPGQDGITVLFHKGRPFESGVLITNNGRYPVRVLGSRRSWSDFFTGRLYLARHPLTGKLTLERFHPFDLAPRQYQWLVFKGVYACTSGAEGGHGLSPGHGYQEIFHTSFPVRYRFHSHTATARIPLEQPLLISFANEACPSRR